MNAEKPSTQIPPSDLGMPLGGIRIVELTQVAAGPYAASLLGDMGADVIKVEPPGGEPFRAIDRLYGPTDSAYFFGVNRSKRAVCVDLKQADGMDVLHRLLENADVFMISMRPSAVAGLGLDYEMLATRYPRLVYCMITAFGEDGPRSGHPGIDILVQACGGIIGTTGEPGRPPVKVGPPITDFATSFLTGFGILAALRDRDRTGLGQKVSLNLLDTSVAMLANFITPYLKTGVPVRPVGGGHPQMVPYQTFQCGDREWLMVACLTEQFWQNLCVAINCPHLINDERFRNNVERVKHRAELGAILDPIFQSQDSRQWELALIHHDVPVSKINMLEDVLTDPQVVNNKMITSVQHPKYGQIPMPNNPIRMSRTPTSVRSHPPEVGEHTDQVLSELDYTPEEIIRLRDLRAIA